MDHVAIMKKSWGLIPKILSGEKKIESRWYQQKRVPWGKVKRGETLYFKNSGEPVSVKAEVTDVLQIENLKPRRVAEILNKYGQKDGLGIDDTVYFYKIFKNKKYCMLVFLKKAEKIKIPFNIDKSGFGNMASWIIVEDIKEIEI